jgi:hypothetical protein
MFCVLDIVLLVLGILAVAKGKFSLSGSRVVEGVPARLVGVLLILPLPASIAIGLLYSEPKSAQGDPFDLLEDGIFTLIQLGILVVTLLLAGVVCLTCSRPRKRYSPVIRRQGSHEDTDGWEDPADVILPRETMERFPSDHDRLRDE